MKKAIFKDFNYSFINSSIPKHKEVVVAYSYMNKPVHQYLFIKEVKGKKNDYYINEAKKIINQKIENGELAKTSKRQIKKVNHIGAKKPILIATSCVLAAGALGTGGYFLGSYLGGGFNKSGHTVVLYAGEFDGSSGKSVGSFKNEQTYLILNNVPDGTKLGDIEGYALPTCGMYDFNKWSYYIPGPYDESTIITKDLMLTATYREGVGYYKALAKQKMYDEYTKLAETKPEIAETLEEIYNTTSEFIDNSEKISDDNNGVNLVNELAEFTLSTMDIASRATTVTPDAIKEVFDQDIKDISNSNDPNQRFALAKICTAYLEVLDDAFALQNTNLDKAFEIVKDEILKISPENATLMKLMAYLGGGFVAGSGYTQYKDEQLSQNFTSYKTVIQGAAGRFDNAGAGEDTINWVGDYFNDYYKCLGKYNTTPAGYLDIVRNTGAQGICVFNEHIAFAMGQITFNDIALNEINLKAAATKALAKVNVKSIEITSDAFLKQFVATGPGSILNISEALNRSYSVLGDYNDPILSEMISKLSTIYTKALDIFAMLPTIEACEPLFANATTSIVPIGTAMAQTVAKGDQTTYKFLKVIETAINSALKIAENIYNDYPDGDHDTNIKTVANNLSWYRSYLSQINYLSGSVDYLIEIYNKVADILPGSHNANFGSKPDLLYDVMNKFSTGQSERLNNNNARQNFTDVATTIFGTVVELYKESKATSDQGASIIDAVINKFTPKDFNTMTELNANMAAKVNKLVINSLSDYSLMIIDNLFPIGDTSLYPMVCALSQRIFDSTVSVVSKYSKAPISHVDNYVSLIDEFFTVIPKLKRDGEAFKTSLTMTALTFFGSVDLEAQDTVLFYVENNLPKANELKAAIKENFHNKITESTTLDELNTIISATQEACKKIIS